MIRRKLQTINSLGSSMFVTTSILSPKGRGTTMATKVNMKHKETGLVKNGFIGFSWTTLLFGAFPALFRGDFLTFMGVFVVLLIVSAFTAGIGGLMLAIVWSFMYNKYYTTKLVEQGYEFCDSEEKNLSAAAAIGQSV